jgi:hypothetical protein
MCMFCSAQAPPMHHALLATRCNTCWHQRPPLCAGLTVCQCMQIMDMIQGVQPLPWEDPDTAPVPSMAEFRRKCNRVLLQTTRS